MHGRLTIRSEATFGQDAGQHWERSADLWSRNRKTDEAKTYQKKKKGETTMASMDKHGADTLYFIRHNMRELPPDKTPSNVEIDPERTKDNYSIISRGKTAEEVNDYRKQIESEIFHYNRKNLVRSVEVVITLPTDCPPEQEEAFFKESYNYVVSTLPMGEKCVFLAEVHKDEGRVQKDGVTVIESPPHMHIMYVPGVPDEKHDGYDFKLCADQLTKRAQLKQFHPKFQKWLDDAGIKATVHSGVTGGQNVSVSELKQLTKETGLTLAEVKELQQDKTTLLNMLQERDQKNTLLKAALHTKDTTISDLQATSAEKDKTISELTERLQSKEAEISSDRAKSAGQSEEVDRLKKQLKAKEQENEQLRSQASQIIRGKDRQIETLTTAASDKEKALSEVSEKLTEKEQEVERIRSKANQVIGERNEQIKTLTTSLSEKDQALSEASQQQQELHAKLSSLEAQLKSKDEELQRERQKTQEVTAQKTETKAASEERTWGDTGAWGRTDGWGNQDKTKEVEKVW